MHEDVASMLRSLLELPAEADRMRAVARGNFDAYTAEARRTVNGALTRREALGEAAMGFAGEASEAAEVVKKHLYQGHPLERARLLEEMGDAMWYMARLCDLCGLRFGDVLMGNIAKLKARYPEQFSTSDSEARRDVNGK